jgi:ferritin-like metal-binding protein YciE
VGEAAWPKTFDEEKATDQKLTSLAEGKVDIRATS